MKKENRAMKSGKDLKRKRKEEREIGNGERERELEKRKIKRKRRWNRPCHFRPRPEKRPH